MDISIDLGRCQGHARCLDSAPAVFGYDDLTNQAYVMGNANPDSDRAGVMEAIHGCPEMAISTEDSQPN